MELSILDSIPDLTKLTSFTDRYFCKRYITNVDNLLNNDFMIMFHSNKIAMLSLAPSHFLFKKEEEFKIKFDLGNIDRSENSVMGKHKTGGQILKRKSVVCKVEFTDGTSFNVRSWLKGKLLEVNEKLVLRPELLRTSPESDGFIALLMTSIEFTDVALIDMFPHEEYIDYYKEKRVSADDIVELINKCS